MAMSPIELRKMVLRLKLLAVLQRHVRLRKVREAGAYWRRLIRPN